MISTRTQPVKMDVTKWEHDSEFESYQAEPKSLEVQCSCGNHVRLNSVRTIAEFIGRTDWVYTPKEGVKPWDSEADWMCQSCQIKRGKGGN